MSKEIKVVNINTPYQVVLNCGLDDGAQVGDRFLVFGIGPVIKDPDTKEDLEALEIVRGKGIVIHIQKKICTIDSIMIEDVPTTIKRTVRSSSPYPILAVPRETEESEITKKRLPFEDVQIGDRARPY